MTASLLRVLSIPVLFGLATGCASGSAPRAPSDNSTVSGTDLERNPGEPIERVLQAKVPGVLVRRTNDGGIALQIRSQEFATLLAQTTTFAPFTGSIAFVHFVISPSSLARNSSAKSVRSRSAKTATAWCTSMPASTPRARHR